MPYIENQDVRASIDRDLTPIVQVCQGQDIGTLVFALTRLVVRYGRPKRGFYWSCLIIGALVCTILEFYRRVVAPYEDEKKEANGDVYNAC